MSVEVLAWNLAIMWLACAILVYVEIKSERLEIVGGKWRNQIGIALAPITLTVVAMILVARWTLRRRARR